MVNKMSSYNGYRSYNAWNVSLWLNNDEGLYSLMIEHVRNIKPRQAAAHALHHYLTEECGLSQTPDGVPFTVTNIREAMTGL